MNLHKLLTVIAFSIGLALQNMSAAQAQSGVTFANYSLSNTTGNVYIFTNSGSGSTFVTAPLNVPVIFTYNVANGYGPAGTAIAAFLNLSATVPTAAVNLGGVFDVQNLTNVNLSIKTASGNNLLSIVNGFSGPSTGNISGFDNDTRGTFGGSNARGDTVAFTSAYLNFAPTTAHGYAVSLTSITPVLSIVPTGPGTGYLNTFQASGSGSFASTLPTPAPEPGSLVVFGVMSGCLAFCFARRFTVHGRSLR